LEDEEVTFTSTEIHDAIEAMAEAKVDESIAESIENNKEYNEKYGGRTVYGYGYGGQTKKVPYPTTPEEFDRDDVRGGIAENFYEAYDFPEEGVELPGLGVAKLVDSYGGEGLGEELWIVVQIGDEFYKFDHFYSSYDGTEPWHGNCTIFPVVGREKIVTEWVSAK
jgi:hypothetical protein